MEPKERKKKKNIIEKRGYSLNSAHAKKLGFPLTGSGPPGTFTCSLMQFDLHTDPRFPTHNSRYANSNLEWKYP